MITWWSSLSPFLDFQIICWPCYDLLLIMWGSSEDHLIIISRISDDFMLIFRCSFGDNLRKIMIIICRIFFDHLNFIGRLSADNSVYCLLVIICWTSNGHLFIIRFSCAVDAVIEDRCVNHDHHHDQLHVVIKDQCVNNIIIILM